MGNKSYNAFNVPHYADPDTPAIRPKAPRQLPDYYQRQKARRMQALQWIYKYLHNHWKEGDRLVIVEGEIVYYDNDGNVTSRRDSRFAGRTGAFKGFDNSCSGGPTMLNIAWDDGKRYKMGPVEFYHFAAHPEELESVQLESVQQEEQGVSNER